MHFESDFECTLISLYCIMSVKSLSLESVEATTGFFLPHTFGDT